MIKKSYKILNKDFSFATDNPELLDSFFLLFNDKVENIFKNFPDLNSERIMLLAFVNIYENILDSKYSQKLSSEDYDLLVNSLEKISSKISKTFE